MMTKRERVNRTIRREELDYLPSQITFADRTRDKEIHAALGLPADVSLDDHIENHMVISLIKHDYPLFYRNDLKLMRELEAEGIARVDEEQQVVYDSWGMGVRVGSDGFFACFHPLENQQTGGVRRALDAGADSRGRDRADAGRTHPAVHGAGSGSAGNLRLDAARHRPVRPACVCLSVRLFRRVRTFVRAGQHSQRCSRTWSPSRPWWRNCSTR